MQGRLKALCSSNNSVKSGRVMFISTSIILFLDSSRTGVHDSYLNIILFYIVLDHSESIHCLTQALLASLTLSSDWLPLSVRDGQIHS